MAVGAGGALIWGENGFGPFGSSRGAFSVGEPVGAGAGVVVVVVVVVVVEVSEGACFSWPPHAVNTPIDMMAAIPSEAATRRVERPVFMVQSCSSRKTM
jgi:hypothetical protein